MTQQVAISIANFWDHYAQAVTLGETGAEGENLLEWMRRYLGVGPYILEVGSGTGRIWELVENAHWDHWAFPSVAYDMCDVSPVMVEKCYENTGVKPTLLTSKTLPYDDDTFCLVISYSVLLHIPPANIAQHLAELARVSRRYVFVSTFDNSGDEPLTMYCFRHPYNDLFDAAGLEVVLFKAFRETRTGSYWLRKRGK